MYGRIPTHCPICLNNGLKCKIKAIQINFQEAVWACESATCLWPFGYRDCTFIPRVVGETWSCYWNNYKAQDVQTKKHDELQDINIESSRISHLTLPQEKLKECENIDIQVQENIDNLTSLSEDSIFNSIFEENPISEQLNNSVTILDTDVVSSNGTFESGLLSTVSCTNYPVFVSSDEKKEDKSINENNFVKVLDNQCLELSQNAVTFPFSTPDIKKETIQIDGLPPITVAYQAQDVNIVSKPSQLENTSVVRKKKRKLSDKTTLHRSMECMKYEKFSFSAIKQQMMLSKKDVIKTKNVESPATNSTDYFAPHIKIKKEEKFEPTESPVKLVVDNTEHLVKKEELVIKKEEPVVIKEESMVKKEEPVVKKEESTVKTEESLEPIQSDIHLTISSVSNSINSIDTNNCSTNLNIDSLLNDFLSTVPTVPDDISDDWLTSLLI
ncbi:uncharacterized protein [Prorops nasuta]|uniref:uncharacterized protein n=1 Tax=Prorops nasuta TaxID=863751 RepID=UPI0034CD4E31